MHSQSLFQKNESDKFTPYCYYEDSGVKKYRTKSIEYLENYAENLKQKMRYAKERGRDYSKDLQYRYEDLNKFCCKFNIPPTEEGKISLNYDFQEQIIAEQNPARAQELKEQQTTYNTHIKDINYIKEKWKGHHDNYADHKKTLEDVRKEIQEMILEAKARKIGLAEVDSIVNTEMPSSKQEAINEAEVSIRKLSIS